MTSTMKSEPGTPPMRGSSFGVSVSAAATRMLGGSADGARGTATSEEDDGGVTALAGETTVVAAPVIAALARNLRRLSAPRGCFRVPFSCAIGLSLNVLARLTRLACLADGRDISLRLWRGKACHLQRDVTKLPRKFQVEWRSLSNSTFSLSGAQAFRIEIVDHDLLAKRAGELLGIPARHHVDSAAGWINGAAGIILCARLPANTKRRNRAASRPNPRRDERRDPHVR